MVKNTKQLFSAIIVLTLGIVACQKQGDVQTQPKPKLTSATIARMPNETRCRIPLSTAIDFTKRWRETKKEGDLIGVEIPIEGLRDILNSSAESGQELEGVRVYLGKTPEGQIKLVYVGMAKGTRQDVLYGIEPNTGSRFDITQDEGVPLLTAPTKLSALNSAVIN